MNFIQTPLYAQFYKPLDRKLTKNLVKRCLVIPFCFQFMALAFQPQAEQPQQFLIESILEDPQAISQLNHALTQLVKDEFKKEKLLE